MLMSEIGYFMLRLTDGAFYLTVLNGVEPYTMSGEFLTEPLSNNDGIFAFTGQRQVSILSASLTMKAGPSMTR
jgi:hypothetical protein